MRNPERIPKICKLIEGLWLANPDQRLGQLLANYVFGHHSDIFFREDDITEYILTNILSQMTKKPKGKKLHGTWGITDATEYSKAMADCAKKNKGLPVDFQLIEMLEEAGKYRIVTKGDIKRKAGRKK